MHLPDDLVIIEPVDDDGNPVGDGAPCAKILVTMTGDDSGTEVSVHTDLSITGKVAQFGRGVLGDVSAKLLGQFVERLEADVLSGDHAAPEPAPASTTRRRSTASMVPSPRANSSKCGTSAAR